jgi:hypothetical protein
MALLFEVPYKYVCRFTSHQYLHENVADNFVNKQPEYCMNVLSYYNRPVCASFRTEAFKI